MRWVMEMAAGPQALHMELAATQQTRACRAGHARGGGVYHKRRVQGRGGSCRV